MTKEKTITEVTVFVNGQVMVFDQYGQQMPKYQGRWEEKKEAILKDAPNSLVVRHDVEWPT